MYIYIYIYIYNETILVITAIALWQLMYLVTQCIAHYVHLACERFEHSVCGSLMTNSSTVVFTNLHLYIGKLY